MQRKLKPGVGAHRIEPTWPLVIAAGSASANECSSSLGIWRDGTSWQEILRIFGRGTRCHFWSASDHESALPMWSDELRGCVAMELAVRLSKSPVGQVNFEFFATTRSTRSITNHNQRSLACTPHRSLLCA